MTEKPIEIKLTFDPETLKSLRSAIFVRVMAMSAISGIADAFLATLIDKIDEGETDWVVKQKKPQD